MSTRLVAYLQSSVARGESGASLVEYAILVALIAAVAITIIGTLGDDIVAIFTDVADDLPAN